MRLGSRAVVVLAAGSAALSALTLACSSDGDSSSAGTGGASAGKQPGGSAGSAGAGRANDGGRGGVLGSAGVPGAGAGGRSGTGGVGGRSSGGRGGSSGNAGTDGNGNAGEGGAGVEPLLCDGNCHYVRADASGSGDGSSWTNAYPALPGALVRGHVYFVAAGAYPAYTFDDAASGDARITVVRATGDAHGDGAGFQDAYAEGEAVFGELDFVTPNYDFDGRNALRAVGSFEGTVVRIDTDSVHFSGVDVDGAFAMNGDSHSAGACTGMQISGDDVSVHDSHVHDIADDGVVVGGSSRFSFQGNEIDSLYGCGTDGGCGPCDNGHSDGLEIYAVRDSEFVGNFAHDIASTSTFFFGNWADELGDGPDDYCENILLANNVLYNPDTGFVVYVEDARGVKLLHNTIWGKHAGRYGGLAVGVNVKGLELHDNVILSINFEHLGSAFDPAEHHGDYNAFGISLGQWPDASHDLVALDPGFSGIPDADGEKVDGARPADFTPTDASPLKGAGTSDVAGLPATDFFGTPRQSPPTLGAIE